MPAPTRTAGAPTAAPERLQRQEGGGGVCKQDKGWGIKGQWSLSMASRQPIQACLEGMFKLLSSDPLHKVDMPPQPPHVERTTLP